MSKFYNSIRKFLLVFCLSQISFWTYAQQRTVTGTVTSMEDEEGIPGVNVLVKGTQRGTVTNVMGEYSIEVSSGEILVFSAVGFTTEEIEVDNRSVVDLAMAPDIQQLSEIVVVGYGEKSRKLMTESIGTVDAKKITQVPVVAADQALQGRVSGVQITNLSGEPGAPAAVRIRGVGTVGNTAPLFVIDGIPLGNAEGRNVNPLATINPSDIESISVLKDASAAAVYGVRAANGVVLITTKRGNTGAPRVNFDGFYGVQRTPELWELNNTQNWQTLYQEGQNNFNAQNDLQRGDNNFLFPHPDIDIRNPDNLLDRNVSWVPDIITQNAPIQNYNLSVSGGTENLNYFISGGYFSQEALTIRNKLDRYTFRANSDYKIGSRFKIGQTFTIAYQDRNGAQNDIPIESARNPTFHRIYDIDNSIPNNRYGFDGNDQVGGATIGNQNGITRVTDIFEKDVRVIGGLNAELQIVEGLTFKSQANLNFNYSRNDRWRPPFTNAELGFDRNEAERRDNRGESASFVYTNTLNYNNSFGDHTIDLLAGIEYQESRSRSLGANGAQFLSDNPNYYLIVQNAEGDLFINARASITSFVGYLSRLSYDFKNRYLFTATLRRDGTSRFSPEDNRRWGTFPSFSGAWRMGEEPFFQGLPIFSEFKVRASWGQLGNANTAAFPHIFRVSLTPDYALNGENTLAAPTPANFVNQDVIWETVETLDFGVDVGLWDDKLTFLATYYDRKTRDFLFNLPIPRTSGFSQTPVNVGLVRNTGFEFEIGYNATIFDEVNMNVSGNLTTVNNEITELAPGVTEFLAGGGYRTAVGFPIGYFYGYETDGLYQNDAEVSEAIPDVNSPQGPRPGDVRFVDNNGPAPEDAPAGVLFSGEPDGRVTPEDRTYLGKTIPDYFYGLNFDFNYRNFDFNIFFQGVGGVQLYNNARQELLNIALGAGARNGLAEAMGRWTGEGTSNTIPRAIASDPNSNGRFSDRFVEDAGFLRLRNLQLGYNIPTEVFGGKVFQSARVYLSATNILTFTPYSGLDPEVMTFASSGSQVGENFANNVREGGAGTDDGRIPIPRIFQLGLNVSF